MNASQLSQLARSLKRITLFFFDRSDRLNKSLEIYHKLIGIELKIPAILLIILYYILCSHDDFLNL